MKYGRDHKMKAVNAGILSGLVLWLIGSGAAGACTVEQRIDLAKAGYDKEEVEALCAEDAAKPAEVQPQADSLTTLTSATYDAATKGGAKHYFGPEKRCQFLADAVRLNDGKTPREFSYDAFSSLSEKGHRFYSKLRNGIVTAHIAITANGGGDDKTCYAMLVRRRDVDADRFDSFVEEKRREYEAVISALRARGVDVEG